MASFKLPPEEPFDLTPQESFIKTVDVSELQTVDLGTGSTEVLGTGRVDVHTLVRARQGARAAAFEECRRTCKRFWFERALARVGAFFAMLRFWR